MVCMKVHCKIANKYSVVCLGPASSVHVHALKKRFQIQDCHFHIFNVCTLRQYGNILVGYYCGVTLLARDRGGVAAVPLARVQQRHPPSHLHRGTPQVG